MIRIFKDNDIKVVTQGAYNSLYKPLGYKPIIEENFDDDNDGIDLDFQLPSFLKRREE